MIHELKVSKSKLVMMRNVLKDSMEDHNGVKVFMYSHFNYKKYSYFKMYFLIFRSFTNMKSSNSRSARFVLQLTCATARTPSTKCSQKCFTDTCQMKRTNVFRPRRRRAPRATSPLSLSSGSTRKTRRKMRLKEWLKSHRAIPTQSSSSSTMAAAGTDAAVFKSHRSTVRKV